MTRIDNYRSTDVAVAWCVAASLIPTTSSTADDTSMQRLVVERTSRERDVLRLSATGGYDSADRSRASLECQHGEEPRVVHSETLSDH